jgi:hypothetical protein
MMRYHGAIFLSCLLFLGLTGLWAQGFGDGAGQSSIPEGILKFGLYGKEWVNVGYNGKTADSGAVGSSGYIALAQDAMLRWDTYAGGEVRGNVNNKILGNLTANGKVYFTNLLSVEKTIWAKDSLRLDGSGGANLIKGNAYVGLGLKLGYSNTIQGITTVPNGAISVQDYAHSNTFGATALTAGQGNQLLAGVNTAANLKWNTAFSRPLSWDSMTYTVPSTAVSFDATKTCSIAQFLTWDNTAATCVLVTGAAAMTLQTAPNGAKVLPPGNYGDISLLYQSKMVLGEGIYNFKSLTLNGAQAQIPVWQPTGGRTQILVEGNISLSQDQFMLRPASTATDFNKAFSATDLAIKGGSVLLYSNGTNVTLGQFTYVWGTVMAPNALIDVKYDSRLFGQALGNQIQVAQNFEGNNGRYIPFYPTKPKIDLVFSGGALLDEGSGGGTKIFPINFSLDHENGLPVTVYFHTQSRIPAQAGNADASDYTGVAKDSITFGVGVISVSFSKVTINKDAQYEADDYFDLVLDSVVNGRLDSVSANNVYPLGIRNDDAPPVMEFADTSTVTVSESVATTLMATELNAASILDAIANVSHSAKNGGMVSSTATTHTISSGLVSGSLVLNWLNDGMDEPDDTVRIALRSGTSMTVGPDSVKTIIITDDDATTKLAPGMQTAFVVAEPAGALSATTTVKVPIVLAGVSGWPITWAMNLLSVGTGGAIKDLDFVLVKAEGAIAPGSLSDTLVVKINNDILDEGDEQIRLVFDPIMGATKHLDFSGKDTISIIIGNNDGPIAVDDSVIIGENAPVGTQIKRLADLLEASPDTTALYDWTLLPGLDASKFNLVNVPVSGWILTVKDSVAFDFELADHVFDVDVRVFGSFHDDTARIVVSVNNVQETPIAPDSASSILLENPTAGIPVDTLFPGENSGWNLEWTIAGGTGSKNFIVTTDANGAAVLFVKTGANIDYEATKTQTLTLVLTNQSGLSDTTWVTVQIKNVLEYTQVSIADATLLSGKVVENPKTIWISDDEFDMTWKAGTKDSNETVKVLKDGVSLIIRTYCDPTKDFCGKDTLVVRRNTKIPVITWEETDSVDSLPKYTVIAPQNPKDTVVYFNDPKKVFGGLVTFVDSLGKEQTVSFGSPKTFKEGKNTTLRYTYVDVYGNTVTASIVVILDTTPPKVTILSPTEDATIYVYNVDVAWTVDGTLMDTLNRASLEGGYNKIVRNYSDLAGNVGSDTVMVRLVVKKNDIVVNLVEAMVDLDPKKVALVEKEYPSRKDERYSLSVVNQQTLDEEEVAYGSASQTQHVVPGSGRVYDGTLNTHLGPTLRVEAKFQQVGGVNGEGVPRGGTLADLLERTRSQDIKDEDVLCGEPLPKDPFVVPIWKNRLQVEVQMFDNMGQFVDRFVVTQDSISSRYLNDGGIGVFYFSLEPDKGDMRLKSTSGRAIANGAYILRGLVKVSSTYLFCSGEFTKGQRVTSTDNILKSFGYRRGE